MGTAVKLQKLNLLIKFDLKYEQNLIWSWVIYMYGIYNETEWGR